MKLHKLLVSLAIAGISTFGLTAYADASDHDSGFYIGIAGGYNHLSKPHGKTFTYTTSTGTADTAMGVGKTSYSLNTHMGYLFNVGSGFDVGPELGFTYYGDYKLKNTATSVTNAYNLYAINLNATGQYTWQSFFARVNGGADFFWVTSGTAFETSSTHKSITEADAGATLGYYFTPCVDAGVYYQHIFGSNHLDKLDHLVPSMDSAGLSLEYAFGSMNGLMGNA